MFDSLKGLWNVLTPVVTSIPKVFGKDFIKERFHLHFSISFILGLAFIRLLFGRHYLVVPNHSRIYVWIWN
jgi:hypothetical protein